MKNKRLRKIVIVLAMLVLAFVVYVEIININSHHMTYRQKVLKAVYPAFMWVNKLLGKSTRQMNNTKEVTAPESLYALTVQLIDGNELPLASLKGKKILLVNTASDCGYTNQYEDLQKLYDSNKEKLEIIAFPANDFKEQEKGSDSDIAAFCKKNYGVSFPLATKSSVVRGPGQNTIFQWLTDKTKNGWNEQQPSWNFSKYLVNEQGMLIHYFDPAVSPSSDEVKNAINE